MAALSSSLEAVTLHRTFEESSRPFAERIRPRPPSALDSRVPVDMRRAGGPVKADAKVSGVKEIHGLVIRVSDGDTIWVQELPSRNPGGNRKYKIRLERIDAPETGQPFGEESKQHLKKLIATKKVVVRYETEDQYGRILGIVYLDGVDINLQMVADGFAWHYSHFDKSSEYIEAESRARAARRGLWAQAFPERPYDFRRRSR